MDQVLARHDDLLVADQSFDDLDPVFIPHADIDGNPLGFSVPNDVHVLRILEPAHCIDRNLQRVGVFSHQHFDAREHPTFRR